MTAPIFRRADCNRKPLLQSGCQGSLSTLNDRYTRLGGALSGLDKPVAQQEIGLFGMFERGHVPA